jgi:hypothetical protein
VNNEFWNAVQAASNTVAGNVSGPVDILSWALRQAGVPVPENALLSSKWMEEQGLMKPVRPGVGQLVGESVGLISPIVAAAKAPQIAAAAVKAGENLAAPRTLNPQTGAIVWHGTPATFAPTPKNPLGEFDATKIGSGEGAQAYGHGHYTAAAKEVGESYQRGLSDWKLAIGGKEVPIDYANRADRSGAAMSYLKAAKDAQAENPFAHAKKMVTSIEGSGAGPIISKLDEWQKAGAAVQGGGSLYKVDLPDEQIAKMLDWDAPLSKQAPEVREAVQKAFPPTFLNGRWLDPVRSGVTGQALLDDLAQIANKRGAPGMRAAEPALKEAGIPGIRYLDGGSRGAGAGTSNYVVFAGNEDKLRILERNGVGLLDEAPPMPALLTDGSRRMETARINAMKPVSEGGLGLGPKNTAQERAKALGFDTEAFHGTPDDAIARTRQFKNDKLGKSTRVSDAAKGHFTSDRGEVASEFIWRDGSTDGGNVLPLLLAGNRAKVTLPGEWMPGKYDAALDAARAGGFDGLDISGVTTLGKPGNYQVTFDPKNMRSRFAAFDPAKRDTADILGGADPYLLSLLGLGAGGAVYFGGGR